MNDIEMAKSDEWVSCLAHPLDVSLIFLSYFTVLHVSYPWKCKLIVSSGMQLLIIAL